VVTAVLLISPEVREFLDLLVLRVRAWLGF
jgi:hypothetical protein